MKDTMCIKQRISLLLKELSVGLYEKDSEVRLALLAAVAGESILLLGPPGVAKSMVARRLKDAFQGAKSFEYLMSRFSTPDEIFGPVSISRLKADDKYERITEGFLPEADVVFLDEIWKAGPAIQNTLLTVVNEKLYRNGNSEIKLPLKLLIGASNELPAEGEGLEALWDRFLLRYVSHCIEDDDTFFDMIFQKDTPQYSPNIFALQITGEEYDDWQLKIKEIGIDEIVKKSILYIRQHLKHISYGNGEVQRAIYVSDRRWKKIVNLLRTSAFFHNRSTVQLSDIVLLCYCLWNELYEIDVVKPIVYKSVFASVIHRLDTLKASLKNDTKKISANRALREMRATMLESDKTLKLYDDYYYRLVDYNTGNTYIYASDFASLPNLDVNQLVTPKHGVIYPDQKDSVKERIRTYSGTMNDNINPVKVTLKRDGYYLYINGVRCDLERYTIDEMMKMSSELQSVEDAFSMDYEAEIEAIAKEASSIIESMHDNIFVCEADTMQMKKVAEEFMRDIAFVRVDIQKLIYGECN